MAEYRQQDNDLIFALDIGTRSIVGVVGRLTDGRFKVLAIETAEHSRRVMLDGQIDNIDEVAALARSVTERLERRLETRLERVCVAAAGRSLRTHKGTFAMELAGDGPITEAVIGQLEAGAVSAVEEALQEDDEERRQYFLVGYTVSQYRLDRYPMVNLLHHSGRQVEADVVATFLPGEVVESLYAAMRTAGLQVASMTLEPIAAMNAAIPADIRLLNLALVDIGAGTSDIALCRDGSVVGYTMVTLAGDEITEAIMQACLVDFQTAEQIKRALPDQSELRYVNVLGLEETVTADAVYEIIRQPLERLAEAIAQQIVSLNGGAPSALFLAGGGSRLQGLRSKMAEQLGMEERRVAIAGSNYVKSAFSDELDLNNPEYATPLGIALSAAMGLLNDSYVVLLNGQPAKLFRSGVMTLQDILMMNGYVYSDMIGRSGKSLTVTLDGRHVTLRGEPATPAVLRLNGEDASIGTLVHAGDRIDFVPARSGKDAGQTLGGLLGADFSGRALVNNSEVPPDTPLRQGDVVLTIRQQEGPSRTAERQTGAQSSPAEKGPAGTAAKPLHVALNGHTLTLPAKADGSPYYLMDLLQYSGIDFQNLDRPVRLEVNGAEAGFQQVLNEHDDVGIYCI